MRRDGTPPRSKDPPKDPERDRERNPPQDRILERLPDPNLANPRLLVNRACIYERHLPSSAYITAHVQRLQHGYYSSPAVSDQDFDHVDFLSITFVFHSANTTAHRFKAATIRATLSTSPPPTQPTPTRHGSNRRETRTRTRSRDTPRPKNRSKPSTETPPRFLKHAPHLLYGTVSPETLQWNYSLTGSLGVADLPLMASITPSGGQTGRYRRYEMMRIQGSVRSQPSPHGAKYDHSASELVWTLEENNLQRSGLPRELTFAMLVQKPSADARVRFTLQIDPVLQFHCLEYPRWWLGLGRYRAVPRKGVDFRVACGQRFAPPAVALEGDDLGEAPEGGETVRLTEKEKEKEGGKRKGRGKREDRRGFNFAALESSFDDYVHMSGKRFGSSIPMIPPPDPQDEDLNANPPGGQGNYSMVNPVTGLPQPPFPAGPGMGMGMGGMPMNPAVATATAAAMGGPMLPPGFDPGVLPMRAMLASQ